MQAPSSSSAPQHGLTLVELSDPRPSERTGGRGARAGGAHGVNGVGAPSGNQPLAALLNRHERVAVHVERCRLHVRAAAGAPLPIWMHRLDRMVRAHELLFSARSDVFTRCYFGGAS